jgi:alkaline phosphatase D
VASTAAQISSGPMLGHTGMTSSTIWIQMEKELDLKLRISSPSEPDFNLEVLARAEAPEFTAHFIVEGLKPGRSYTYKIEVPDLNFTSSEYSFKTQVLWQYRQPAPDFSIAMGSCSYINEEAFDRPGEGYGGNYEIFETIAQTKPDLMLWLGDNTYFREADLSSYGGMVHRYTHTRKTLEMQALLRACPNYAIWDDHDFGPNDANGSFIFKNLAHRAFREFWANPSYGFNEKESTCSQFAFNDAEFFLLDNRSFRTDYDIKTLDPQILGKEQIDWLIQSLKFSKSVFKFVLIGGQFLSDYAIYENHIQYEQERANIIRRIAEENIGGVVFLSGDRHSSSLSKLEISAGRAMYDLTVSPLSSTAYDHSAEPNTNRIDGSSVSQRNFGIISISGKKGERIAEIGLYAVDGKQLWTYRIQEQDLY